MEQDVKDKDVLLVKDKSNSELYAATQKKDGTVEGIKPDSVDNPDLIKFDKNGNVLENFFENFKRQIKNPTQFEFFRVPAEMFMQAFNTLQQAFQNPDAPENKKTIDMHRVYPEESKQSQAQSSEKSYAIDPGLVQWEKMEKFGITREALEKTGNFDKLLDYRKTDLLQVSIKIDEETTVRTDVRFSLRKQEDGSFVPAVHPIRHKPDLERSYFGVAFTEADKQNLLTTGNLGRVIEAEFRQGEKTPILLSLDKLTNELVSFRSEWVRVPETIKGVELSEMQKQELLQGKAVYLDNMTSKNGNSFSAFIQFNADKRSFEFLFDNSKQNQQQSQSSQMPQDIQKTFRGKELTEDQRDSLRESKAVYVDGLKDKNGKEYSGYININKETGKTDFMFSKGYKDALANGTVTPDDRHKAQTAANSEGTTGRSEKQEVKKSKGLKM